MSPHTGFTESQTKGTGQSRCEPQARLSDHEANIILLSRYTGKRPMRAHNGTVIAMRSNMRWCSNVFEIACANGQIVRVAFSLHCCNREMISFVATTGCISSAIICDLMIQSVEHRFGSVDRAPHRIEWLSDKGSCYTAKQTREFACQLSLVCCTTPVSSPERNGMAETSLKHLKEIMFTSIIG